MRERTLLIKTGLAEYIEDKPWLRECVWCHRDPGTCLCPQPELILERGMSLHGLGLFPKSPPAPKPRLTRRVT